MAIGKKLFEKIKKNLGRAKKNYFLRSRSTKDVVGEKCVLYTTLNLTFNGRWSIKLYTTTLSDLLILNQKYQKFSIPEILILVFFWIRSSHPNNVVRAQSYTVIFCGKFAQNFTPISRFLGCQNLYAG